MARSAPPRFVVRTTVATLIMVAGVLSAVFVAFALHVRERVRDAVSDKLDAGQRMLSALEQRRERELGVQVATIAGNPDAPNCGRHIQAGARATEPRYRRGMLTPSSASSKHWLPGPTATSSRSPTRRAP